MDDNRKIQYLEALIYDAERRIGAYVASTGSEDPYIQKQIEKIEHWYKQINEFLKLEN